jgi:hypothetical protein
LDTHLFDKTSTLLDRIVKRRVRVKDLTLSAVNLTLPLPQLALFPWDTSQTKAQALMAAIDQVREKFGQKALVLGRSF